MKKTSILYLTWKTRIERPHQTCFLKKDMQTEETTCFWFLDRQYKKCFSLRFGTYSCLSHEVGWRCVLLRGTPSGFKTGCTLWASKTLGQQKKCPFASCHIDIISIYVKNIILLLCSRFFPVTFLGVLSDHFRAKWPPFGWSKGHLEEAGYMTYFYVVTYMLSWNIICLSDVVYSTIESRTPKVQRAHPKMKGF